MPDKQTLNSETRPDYEPSAIKEEFGEVVPHAEKAKTTLTISPLEFSKNIGSTLVRQGSDVRKFANEARTNRDVALALNTVIAAVFWVKGEIRSTVNYDEDPRYEILDRHIIEEIESDLRNLLYQPWGKTQRAILQGARECGFSVSELVWEYLDDKSRWRLAAIKTKKSWDFNPVVDAYDNLYALKHYPTGQWFNPEAFVFGVYPFLEYGNYLGESVLESVYNDLQLIKSLEAAQAANADKSALKVLLHHYTADRTPEEQTKINKELDAAFNGKNQGLIHSPAVTALEGGDWKPDDDIRMLESRESAKAMDIINKIIEERRKDVKRTLGLPDDLGNTTVPQGSWAKASVAMNVFVMQAQEAQEWLVDTVNEQIIRRWVRYNYPELPEDYTIPEFAYPEIEEDVSLERLQFIQGALESGLLDKDNPQHNEYIKDHLGLPTD